MEDGIETRLEKFFCSHSGCDASTAPSSSTKVRRGKNEFMRKLLERKIKQVKRKSLIFGISSRVLFTTQNVHAQYHERKRDAASSFYSTTFGVLRSDGKAPALATTIFFNCHDTYAFTRSWKHKTKTTHYLLSL